MLLSEAEAEDTGLAVGDVLAMTFARTRTKDFRVGGIYAVNELLGGALISTAKFEENFTERLDFVVLAKGAPGVDLERARTAIERVTADYPNVTVRDQAETKEQQREQVNQLLSLVSALLGLAILIAFFGIVNTLALSVFERTRELGLLRAVGMSRRQVRSMVRAESVITAVMGAILGLVIGVIFGAAIVSALDSEGASDMVIPGRQLLVCVIVAAWRVCWPRSGRHGGRRASTSSPPLPTTDTPDLTDAGGAGRAAGVRRSGGQAVRRSDADGHPDERPQHEHDGQDGQGERQRVDEHRQLGLGNRLGRGRGGRRAGELLGGAHGRKRREVGGGSSTISSPISSRTRGRRSTISSS